MKYKNEILDFHTKLKPKLEEVCHPLESHLNLKLLSFRRFYDTGKLLYVFNNEKWKFFSLEQEWWHRRGFSRHIPLLKNVNFLNYIWPEQPPENDEVYQNLYRFNIWNGIVMYKRYNHYTESYAFYCDCSNAARDVYQNHLYALDNFIVYFRSKMEKFLSNVDNNILIDFNIQNLYKNKNSELDKNIETFFKEVLDRRTYLLNSPQGDLILSKREIDCLLMIMQGRTAKEAARKLDLSQRTVESYILNARQKADTYRNSELVTDLLCEISRYSSLRF